VLDLSPDKLLMLAAVALVVLGPNRLPGAARSLGRFIGQLRAMSSTLQTEVRDALHDPEDAFKSTLADLRPSEVRRTVRRAVSETLAPLNPVIGGAPASSNAHPVAPRSSNVAPTPASGPTTAPGPDGSAPSTGGAVPAAPDDPGFN
jgi:sec-independent protein translocase protein TatB